MCLLSLSHHFDYYDSNDDYHFPYDYSHCIYVGVVVAHLARVSYETHGPSKRKMLSYEDMGESSSMCGE